MNISSKGKYSLRLLTYLGVEGSMGRRITLKEIASTELLSEKYLWQVASQLKAAGLIKAVPGPRGGFVLSKGASSITLAEALAVFDPELFRNSDSDAVPLTANRTACSVVVADKLREIDTSLERLLAGVSIGELVDAHRTVQSNGCFYQI